jgi:predicted nucleic-acid-binding protein
VRAIDTNLLVRFLTNDDEDQSRRARQAVAEGEAYVASTVLLEAERVLRAGYKLPRQAVVQALGAFVNLPQVRLSEPGRVAKALDWAMAGMDFADALHLAEAEDCEGFLSFDRSLQRMAERVGAVRVREP